MSPRPRTLADSDILAATARAISRVGPARLTLGDVASEIGLAPATLLQRFGSKRGLLLAFSEQAAAEAAREFAAARQAGGSPLRILLDVLVGMTRDIATPDALSNNLAYLQLDLTDPDFHHFALEHARTVQAQITALLDEAVAAGELIPCDTARLARAVQVTYNGSLLLWAIERQGQVADWLRSDLEFLLRSFLAASPARG